LNRALKPTLFVGLLIIALGIGVYLAGGPRLIYLQITNPKAAQWERKWRGRNDYIADNRLFFAFPEELTKAEQQQVLAQTKTLAAPIFGKMIGSYGKFHMLVAVCEGTLSKVGVGETFCTPMGEVFAISNPRADDPRFQSAAADFAGVAKGAGFKAVMISGRGRFQILY
jgi:hypothetical protein